MRNILFLLRQRTHLENCLREQYQDLSPDSGLVDVNGGVDLHRQRQFIGRPIIWKRIQRTQKYDERWILEEYSWYLGYRHFHMQLRKQVVVEEEIMFKMDEPWKKYFEK